MGANNGSKYFYGGSDQTFYGITIASAGGTPIDLLSLDEGGSIYSAATEDAVLTGYTQGGATVTNDFTLTQDFQTLSLAGLGWASTI